MDGRSTSLPRCADDAEVADERLERLPVSVLQHLIVQIRPTTPDAAPNKCEQSELGGLRLTLDDGLACVLQCLSNEQSDLKQSSERRKNHLSSSKRSESACV
jgi:hypothetical protein